MLFTSFVGLLVVVVAAAATAAGSRKEPQYHRLPTLRKRAELEDSWTAQRLATVPKLLQKYGVDAWLVSQREYAEDTIFRSYKPSVAFSARRRTLSLFHTNTSTLSGHPNPITWIDITPHLWVDVAAVLEAYDPGRIAINVDPSIAFADGLHVGEKEAVERGLGEKWAGRFASVQLLAVEFIAFRVGGSQLEWYKRMMETVWAMIARGFSAEVITVGETTTEDVVWWFREQMDVLNVTTWFHPSVTRFHAPLSLSANTTAHHDPLTIQPGDMLHVDIGITAMNLNTDTQHLAYVPLYPHQPVPASLRHGLSLSNRMQDLVLAQMNTGKTGNRVLKEVRARMSDEGIPGLVYCHPIGDFGHSAGSIIGLTDHQEGVPVMGDLPILPHTYYSIELSASAAVPEWGGGEVLFQQEEDVYYEEESGEWRWVWGRQEEFWVVDWEGEARGEGEREREGGMVVQG